LHCRNVCLSAPSLRSSSIGQPVAQTLQHLFSLARRPWRPLRPRLVFRRIFSLDSLQRRSWSMRKTLLGIGALTAITALLIWPNVSDAQRRGRGWGGGWGGSGYNTVTPGGYGFTNGSGYYGPGWSGYGGYTRPYYGSGYSPGWG